MSVVCADADLYVRTVDCIKHHDYNSLLRLIDDETATKYLNERGFDLLEMLVYTFMENKDKLIIRCMNMLNKYVSPKERLLAYMITIDNISSLTLCLHFARNLYKDLPFLNKENIVEVRNTMVPKLYKNLVQFAHESGGTFVTDSTVLIIFLQAVVRLFMKSGCQDECIRAGFLTEVLMKRPFFDVYVRKELNKLLKTISFRPRCFEGLWIPCTPEELPFFILNECAEEERADLLPRVYNPTFLLMIIRQPMCTYFEKYVEDPVYLKNVFMSVSYVGRMIDPLSIPRDSLGEYKCLFSSLLKTNGSSRETVDNFNTMEVFQLLLESLEPVAQYLLLRELTKMVYTGELQNPFALHTIASLIDLYRKSARHSINEYQVFRDEIGAFYAQILTMMDEGFDFGHTFYTSICVLIQNHCLGGYNFDATKTAREIIAKLKAVVEEEKSVHKLITTSTAAADQDIYYQDFESEIRKKIDFIEFQISETELKLDSWTG